MRLEVLWPVLFSFICRSWQISLILQQNWKCTTSWICSLRSSPAPSPSPPPFRCVAHHMWQLMLEWKKPWCVSIQTYCPCLGSPTQASDLGCCGSLQNQTVQTTKRPLLHLVGLPQPHTRSYFFSYEQLTDRNRWVKVCWENKRISDFFKQNLTWFHFPSHHKNLPLHQDF